MADGERHLLSSPDTVWCGLASKGVKTTDLLLRRCTCVRCLRSNQYYLYMEHIRLQRRINELDASGVASSIPLEVTY